MRKLPSVSAQGVAKLRRRKQCKIDAVWLKDAAFRGTVGKMGGEMEKVRGIGGVFFRAKDPEALGEWYAKNLGVPRAPTDMETPPWVSDGGVTVFAPFSEATDYFPASQQIMINFRVDDLDAILARLAAAGIASSKHHDIDDVGRFAWVYDPEGNPIELWEPVASGG